MKKMNALIITKGKYPNDDASSLRLHYLANMLAECDCSVHVISRNKKEKAGVYQNIPFSSVRNAKANKLADGLHYMFSEPRAIKNWIRKNRPAVIMVVTSCQTLLMNWLIRHKEKYGYTLLHDSVEWYSKEQFRHPYRSYSYLKKQLWMLKVLRKPLRIVAISHYIEDHFKAKGLTCVRIPSVCNPGEVTVKKELSEEKITIVYAGAIGRKDHFEEIISALEMLSEAEQNRFELRIIGSTAQGFVNDTGIANDRVRKLDNCLKFLGRVPRETVLEQLNQANFTILIRPENQRHSQAGFPTKVPESLVTGTPVICNYTSDLKEYLVDRKNAIIVEACSTDAVHDALQKILSLTAQELQQMTLEARKTAEECFDYHLYSDVLKTLLPGQNP